MLDMKISKGYKGQRTKTPVLFSHFCMSVLVSVWIWVASVFGPFMKCLLSSSSPSSFFGAIRFSRIYPKIWPSSCAAPLCWLDVLDNQTRKLYVILWGDPKHGALMVLKLIEDAFYFKKCTDFRFLAVVSFNSIHLLKSPNKSLNLVL